jgi:hypothetical protein
MGIRVQDADGDDDLEHYSLRGLPSYYVEQILKTMSLMGVRFIAASSSLVLPIIAFRISTSLCLMVKKSSCFMLRYPFFLSLFSSRTCVQ